MRGLSALERSAMDMLLAGNHHVLELLRQQYAVCSGVRREETGVGVFVKFLIPPDTKRVRTNRNFEISDVSADIEGLQFGVGFVLFVRGGLIDCFEAHLWGDDQWPERIEHYSLYYTKIVGVSVVRISERDWDAITKLLEGL